MPEVAVDIKITCCECDEDLCGTMNVHDDGYGNGTLSITLPPCQKCMDDARAKAHQAGDNEGHEAGMAQEAVEAVKSQEKTLSDASVDEKGTTDAG